MNVSIKKPRVNADNVPAVINGVYGHLFNIEECSSGRPKIHSVQYSDIITKQIEILELNDET